MSNEPEYFRIPDQCPVCSGVVEPEGFFLYCRSKSCPVQLSGSVRVWIKRLGLLHWGDALIDALTDQKRPVINSLGDLYRLTLDDLAECSSGMKMAKKCYDVLHSNKSITLELMLASLNIPNFAVSTATDIVHAGYDTIDKVLSLTEEDLKKVPNVGSITAKYIYEGIQERRELIIDLASVLDIRKPSCGPLTGKSFCITGATSVPRKALQKSIMDAGGVVKESVGSGLSFLVTNEVSRTEKRLKAEKYGTFIISESDLQQMISS